MADFSAFNAIKDYLFKDDTRGNLRADQMNAITATLAQLIQAHEDTDKRITKIEKGKTILVATLREQIAIPAGGRYTITAWNVRTNPEGWTNGDGSPQVPDGAEKAEYEVTFKTLVSCKHASQPPRFKVALNVNGQEYALAEANMNGRGLSGAYRLTTGTWFTADLSAGWPITVVLYFESDDAQEPAFIEGDRNTELTIKRQS